MKRIDRGDWDVGLLGLVKFGCKEHLEEIRRGSLYMNPVKRFQKLEEENSKRGRGDDSDGKIYLPGARVRFIPEDGGPNLECIAYNLQIKPVQQNYIFCMFAINKKCIVDIVLDDINRKLIVEAQFSEDQKKTIRSHFGDVDGALYIHDPKGFLRDVENAAAQHKSACMHKEVDYANKFLTDEETAKKLVEYDLQYAAFYKDRFFCDENEYRIMLGLAGESAMKLPIADQQHRTYLFELEELLNLKMTYSFDFLPRSEVEPENTTNA